MAEKSNAAACNTEKVRSPWRIAWMRLKRHKLAMISAYILVIMYVSVILAGFLAPYHMHTTQRNNYLQPPSKIYWKDENGKLSMPFVYKSAMLDPLTQKYEEIKDKKYYIKLFTRSDDPRNMWSLFGLKSNVHLFGARAADGEEGLVFLMGSDDYGRDLFSRILYGGRASLFVGWAGIVITLTIGMLFGGISGYYGGIIDNIMMRSAEIIMSIPSFYLLLALAAVLPRDLSSTMRYFLIVAILSFISWAGMARIIRGMVLSIKTREYVQAARAIGTSDMRIITKHILPNTLSFVIVSATLSIPSYILGESGLSFLGLGIQEPDASWGNMLTSAMNLQTLERAPWNLLAGVFIFAAVLCYNLFGDGLRDAFDPRSKL
ncbi:MAG TPA: ABC transporter permease [Bacillota bacterium]|nr:ABC transporter permease [Bacillota bacterium]HOA14913.1 ABC transporter permease [Bacillota bacterium]